MKGKTAGTFPTATKPPFSANESLSEKGQKNMEKEYEEDIKTLEDMSIKKK